MHTIRKAVCLHAQADDLTFLNPVRNRLGRLLGDGCQSFELGDQHSHADALLALERAAGAFVVIFAHGGSDYLRGGEYFSRRTGEMVEVEKFLTRQNLRIFNGKVVFCLSCDSNGLAQASLEAGALAFVGFDEVPFNRFDSAGHPIGSKVLIQHTQTLIADAVKAALESFVTGRLMLHDAIEYLRLWIDQHAVRYVRRNVSVPDRRDIAALFLKVKDGVRYHGEREIRFVKGA